MDEIDRLVAQLPPGYSHEWTGLSHQERLSGNQALSLYAISALVVFLCLAALYESWSIPFAVMLSVPIGIFGALLAASLFGQTNDVYFKVGLLTTIGLAAKNAILIVEFAIERQTAGMGLVEATLEAARQRLRPILMTSLAFILGVTPLAIASGAGSGAQNSVGIGVMGGMIAATVIGVFLVPLLFVTVRRIFKGRAANTGYWATARRRQQPTSNKGSSMTGFERGSRGREADACAYIYRRLLSGCVVGPDYQKPFLAMPASWSDQKPARPARPPQLSQWWQRLRDPQLNTLVDEAVAGNLDVATAKAKIRQARASYRQSAGTLFPTADGSGSATRNKSAATTTGGGASDAYGYYQAGFDASWELDLFGANRRGVEAARYGVGCFRAGIALDAADPGRRRRLLLCPGARLPGAHPAGPAHGRIATADRRAHPHHAARRHGNGGRCRQGRGAGKQPPRPMFRRWRPVMPKPCTGFPC